MTLGPLCLLRGARWPIAILVQTFARRLCSEAPFRLGARGSDSSASGWCAPRGAGAVRSAMRAPRRSDAVWRQRDARPQLRLAGSAGPGSGAANPNRPVQGQAQGGAALHLPPILRVPLRLRGPLLRPPTSLRCGLARGAIGNGQGVGAPPNRMLHPCTQARHRVFRMGLLLWGKQDPTQPEFKAELAEANEELAETQKWPGAQ